MLRSSLSVFILAALSGGAVACASPSDDVGGSEGSFTSNSGKTLEFKFKGEVLARENDTARKAVASQLQYIQGILTSDVDGNGQSAMPVLSNVEETAEGDKKRITYEASLAVIWPNREAVPAPRRARPRCAWPPT